MRVFVAFPVSALLKSALSAASDLPEDGFSVERNVRLPRFLRKNRHNGVTLQTFHADMYRQLGDVIASDE